MNVYLADVVSLEDPEKFDTLYRVMDPVRRKKIDRYRFHKDQRLSLGAGALLQKALCDASLTGARISITPTGKPCLKDDENCFFSLSHSGSKVLCAIAEVPIGCDIEEITTQSLQLMDQVLAPDERKLLTHQTEDKQEELFHILWTGKESYLKMTGEGLVDHLDDISVRIPLGTQVVQGQSVTFLEIPCGSNYKAAICVKGVHEAGELQIQNIYF